MDEEFGKENYERLSFWTFLLLKHFLKGIRKIFANANNQQRSQLSTATNQR